MVIYLDIMMIFSGNMEDHKKHLALVFDALNKNHLYLKKLKCTFSQSEISFLGHIVGQGHI